MGALEIDGATGRRVYSNMNCGEPLRGPPETAGGFRPFLCLWDGAPPTPPCGCRYRSSSPKRSAQDLAGDRFIAYGTWKWMEMHLKTGQAPVYRYRFEQTLPLAADAAADAEPAAPHASEIEFVFQVLSSRKLPWRPEDRKVSDLMGSYWSNFAKTGDPNGDGLARWPAYSPDGYQVVHLRADPGAAPDAHRARYQFLDGVR